MGQADERDIKAAGSPVESFALSDDQIRKNLCTNELPLINAIYNTCAETLYKEEDRSKAIDTKGASTLGMLGVSLSLVFSLGGLLIDKISNLPLPYVGCPVPWLVFFYGSTSATLFIAAIITLFSIRVRSDWRGVKDSDLFHGQMIEEGEGPYKRYLSTHFWKVYKNNFRVNETKGKYLKAGQILYIIALFQLLPIIVIIGLYSLRKGGYF